MRIGKRQVMRRVVSRVSFVLMSFRGRRVVSAYLIMPKTSIHIHLRGGGDNLLGQHLEYGSGMYACRKISTEDNGHSTALDLIVKLDVISLVRQSKKGGSNIPCTNKVVARESAGKGIYRHLVGIDYGRSRCRTCRKST